MGLEVIAPVEPEELLLGVDPEPKRGPGGGAEHGLNGGVGIGMEGLEPGGDRGHGAGEPSKAGEGSERVEPRILLGEEQIEPASVLAGGIELAEIDIERMEGIDPGAGVIAPTGG